MVAGKTALQSALMEQAEKASSLCTLGTIMTGLTPRDRDFLQKALDSDMSHRGIWAALQAANHKVSRDVVAAHRAKTCICNRKAAS